MRISSLLLLLPLLSGSCLAADLRPEDEARLTTLSQSLSVPVGELRSALAKAQLRQPVLDAIQRPWEAKPWHQYWPIFLTETRIQAGVEFWRQHAATLARAEQTYQVPANIIVAIIGVETLYGQRMGDHPVLDALYTLGFHYPPRSDFFSKEFAHYVRLSREQGWPLAEKKGSYAGAMGMGQFIPSSYLNFAVDFDGDGKRDLFGNPSDAIGSVANYFHQHKWRLGEPVADQARIADAAAVEPFLSSKLELTDRWEHLALAGVDLAAPIAPTTPVKLLRLEQAEAPEYWVARHNFYVITRYNRSPLYAMAVYQLSQKIAEAHHGR